MVNVRERVRLTVLRTAGLVVLAVAVLVGIEVRTRARSVRCNGEVMAEDAKCVVGESRYSFDEMALRAQESTEIGFLMVSVLAAVAALLVMGVALAEHATLAGRDDDPEARPRDV